MPYLADYSYVSYAALAADPETKSYKQQIKEYWELRIDTLYPAYSASMKNQLWTYLNSITTAEDNYKAAMNSLDSVDTLRYRWQTRFGYLVLYVFYAQCIEFPTDANLPAVPGMMIPLNTGEPLKKDDLRCFATPWRYTWPGDGMTDQPWFNLSAGTVSLRATTLPGSIPEVTAIINALNSRYPIYTARYSNADSYNIGAETGSGLTSISDLTGPRLDYHKFWYNDSTASVGFVDRMAYEFLNGAGWTTQNYERYRTGKAIMAYLAGGGAIAVKQSPKEWMIENGGRDLMDYFGWQDLSASVLFELPEEPDDITPPDPGLGAGFGVRFGEEFA